MNKKILILFLGILILAAILRFYKLTEVPSGVNQDEASIGYTAYSLLKTSKDEYGRQFPVSFQSFGDWKLPLYIYSVVPLISIFGMSELAVRLPSAVFGIATVGLTFFLVRFLFKNNTLALLTMFLVAVSPWHLHLSRVESESNTAVFLITLAVILFLKSFKNRNLLIIFSLFFFALTYLTYAGNYIFTTLFLLGLILIYQKEIPRTKYFLAGVILFLLLVVFIWSSTFFANRTKISGIGIFGNPSLVHAEIEMPRNEHQNPQEVLSRFFHNRLIFGIEKFGQSYLNSFSSEFLFIKGGTNKAHNIKNFGNMYLIEAPFLFLGLASLIFIRKGREKRLVLWWFFIAPIAASITKDAPHTNRMFAIFPIMPLVTAMGAEWAIRSVSKKIKYLAIGICIILFLVNFGLYLDRYYVHFPKDEAQNWGAGYKKLNEILQTEKFKDKKVIVARPEYSPYIYLLFYQKYDPKKYQEIAVRYPQTEDGFVHVKGFDRYEFREIDWGKDLQLPNRILIDWTSRVADSAKKGGRKTEEVILPNGDSMFTLVETK